MGYRGMENNHNGQRSTVCQQSLQEFSGRDGNQATVHSSIHHLSKAVEGFAPELAPRYDGLYQVMDFASPVICKIRHVNIKKERTIHESELKQQQTQNTSETTLKLHGSSKDSLMIPKILQGSFKDMPRTLQRHAKDTPRTLHGNFKDS